MEIYLGYETALACLRSLDKIDHRLLVPNSNNRHRPPDSKTIKEALAWMVDENEKLHLIIPDAKLRRSNDLIAFHIWNPETCQPCFFRLGNGVFVSTPEALFAQLSRNANEITLMKLAFELCGSYALDKKAQAGFRNRPPLTTADKLSSFIQSLGLGEKSHAARAVKFVRNGSASPMETRLALLLGLPATLGGFGLGMPEMNAEVTPSAKTASDLNHDLYHCDLYWPERGVALEYNSTAFHLSERAITNDSKRLNDLQSIGVTTFTATKNQVFTPREMERIAHKLAKAMGKRVRCVRKDADYRKMKLREELFSRSPWE